MAVSFQENIEEFEKRDVAVVGCSVDSKFSHWKWLTTEQKDGGIKGVKYPLVADNALQYSEEYGEVCPANWRKGDKALKETQDSVASYLGNR